MSQDMLSLIKQNRTVFWDIPENKLHMLSEQAILERFISFSDIPQIRKLFALIGEQNAADIFFRIKNNKRNSLRQSTINLFQNYFTKHVH